MPRFHVQRSILIEVSPQQVYDKLVDFNSWTHWSPWLISEPEATVTVTPNANQIGAVYAWAGKIVGAGEVEHKQLEAPHKIEDEIRFLKPFRSQSTVGFEIQPSGPHTRLTWLMDGSLPWFMFWMRPMMETFISMDYDRGLRMFKEWLETGQVQSHTAVKGKVSVGPLHMLGVRATCDVADVESSMEGAFNEAQQLFRQQGLAMDGGMISVYHKFDVKAATFEYTSGYLVPQSALEHAGGLSAWSLPAGPAFCVEHIGSYQHLGNPWSVANQLVRHQKLKQSKVGTFELYKTTPPETPEPECLTEIYLPLRK